MQMTTSEGQTQNAGRLQAIADDWKETKAQEKDSRKADRAENKADRAADRADKKTDRAADKESDKLEINPLGSEPAK